MLHIPLQQHTQLTAILDAQSLKLYELTLRDWIWQETKDKLITLLLAHVGDYNADWFDGWIDYKSVANALSKYMQAESVKNNRLNSSYHASGTGDCIRKRTYSRIILPKQDFVAENYLSTILGNFIGDSIQSLMQTLPGFVVCHDGVNGIEMNFNTINLPEALRTHYKEHQVSARADFVCNSKMGPIVGDIKSIAGKYWQTWGGWPGWYSEKQQHWAKQISKEIYHYRDMKGFQPLHGLVVEVNRDTFELRCWQFDYTDELKQWLEDEEFPDIKRSIEALNKWVKLPLEERVYNILPPGQKDRCDKFCGYKDICPDNIY